MIMWNVRMRASRKGRKNQTELHISGAETICRAGEIDRTASRFLQRAITHPRGRPDRVVLTIEDLPHDIRSIPMLDVKTIGVLTPEDAWQMIYDSLLRLAVSPAAARAARRVLTGKRQMRGAALIDAKTGKRLEPDRQRGVRVSRLGIDPDTRTPIGRMLNRRKINSDTVREALTLASKVAGHPSIVAEVCISDDPDYTTGYLAARSLGYLRVPNIKPMGALHGGRVFFLKPDGDVEKVIHYLQREAVLITHRAPKTRKRSI